MNSPNQHIPVNNIDPGKNVGDGEGSVGSRRSPQSAATNSGGRGTNPTLI